VDESIERLYGEFLKCVEIDYILLRSLVTERVPWRLVPKKAKFEVDITGGEEVETVSENHIVIEVRLSIETKQSANHQETNGNEASDRTVFTIECSFEMGYSLSLSPSLKRELSSLEDDGTYLKKIVELFARRNCRLNVWPYVREIVQSITTRMGFPPLIIPLYKE